MGESDNFCLGPAYDHLDPPGVFPQVLLRGDEICEHGQDRPDHRAPVQAG